MTSKKRRTPFVDMRGSTANGCAFGDHASVKDNTFFIGAEQPRPELVDLRAAVAAARDELVASATSGEARTEVDRRLGQIEDELAEEEPEGPVVRNRWDKVIKVLGPLATASGHIAKITELITGVFRGS